MPFTIPEGIAPEVLPLAWLVGRWAGDGVIVYPTIPEARVRQEVEVGHDGGPYLTWTSTLWLEADDGGHGPVWATESGYWRVPPDVPLGSDGAADGQASGAANGAAAGEASGRPDGRRVVELLLTDPAGHLTLYAGTVGNGRIELSSDLIARTPDAAEISAATRLYGLVQGDLMWAWDIAAFGEPLQSYASARLRRVA